MRRKVKEFMTDMLAGAILTTLFCTFVLGFIFIETNFFICVWVGILATITFAALHWSKEIICE